MFSISGRAFSAKLFGTNYDQTLKREQVQEKINLFEAPEEKEACQKLLDQWDNVCGLTVSGAKNQLHIQDMLGLMRLGEDAEQLSDIDFSLVSLNQNQFGPQGRNQAKALLQQKYNEKIQSYRDKGYVSYKQGHSSNEGMAMTFSGNSFLPAGKSTKNPFGESPNGHFEAWTSLRKGNEVIVIEMKNNTTVNSCDINFKGSISTNPGIADQGPAPERVDDFSLFEVETNPTNPTHISTSGYQGKKSTAQQMIPIR